MRTNVSVQDRFQCSNSTARMASVRNRDEVNRMLHDFSGCTRRKAGKPFLQ